MTIEQKWDQFLQRCFQSGIATPETIQGCTPEEVQTLSQKYNRRRFHEQIHAIHRNPPRHANT